MFKLVEKLKEIDENGSVKLRTIMTLALFTWCIACLLLAMCHNGFAVPLAIGTMLLIALA